jgi:hypothetical protein
MPNPSKHSISSFRRPFTPLGLVSVLLALVGCGRGPAADPAASQSASGAGAGAPRTGGAPDDGPGYMDPTLGGSAVAGSGEGLVILNPTDSERPFFRDFGQIKRGESRDWTIQLLNQDPTPVEVLDVRTPCGCMSVRVLRARLASGEVVLGDQYRKEPPLLVVPPGAVLEIELLLTTDRVQANMDKLALFRVLTSSPASANITFEAHLMALDSFMATPHQLAFGDVPQGFGGRTKVRILAEPRGSAAKILGIAEQGQRVRAEFEETFYGGEFVWHVLADLPALEPLGAVRDRIVLRTTDALGQGDAGRMTLQALGTVVPDVRITPPLFAFGARKPDESGELVGRVDALVPGARTKVLGHRFEGPSAASFEASFEPLQPDDAGRSISTQITVKLRPGHAPGAMAARLHLDLDDPQNPTATAAVSGFVR